MDTFCDGELLHSILLLQRFLVVGWNGVMDLSVDIMRCQMTLQFVPAGRKNGEDVEDVG